MQRLNQLTKIVSTDGILTAVEAGALWLGCRLFGHDRAYHAHAMVTGFVFDLWHQSATGGVIQLNLLGIEGTAGRHYIATPPRLFRKIVSHLPIQRSRFTFVDLGCGKGRALMLAAAMGFRRMIGVDHSPDLLTIARSNTKGVAELVCADCRDFVFPPEPTVIFMFNPFWQDVMAQIVTNLEHSLASAPREMYIVYYRPAVREPFDRSHTFHLLKDSNLVYPWYALYTTADPSSAG
jgi:SAM-dependent methyltransferase